MIRRIAHAVRGLKSERSKRVGVNQKSHRSRGAWIEIFPIVKGVSQLNLVASLTRCVD